MTTINSFGSRATLDVAGTRYTMYRLDALRAISGNTVDRLPFSLKILLENLLRNEDDAFAKDIVDHSTGIAWYRKHFTLPAAAQGRKVFLEFEGARQAGHDVGEQLPALVRDQRLVEKLVADVKYSGYVERQSNQLVPTYTAFAVTGLLEAHFPAGDAHRNELPDRPVML